VRGIPLPYRPDPRDGAKGPGLANALREAGGRSRTPMSIVVITDLDGIGAPDELTSTVKLLRLHGHAVSFVVPDGTTYMAEPSRPIDRDVYRVYARAEQRRIEEARVMFAPLGVPVVRATAEDKPGIVLVKAQARTRRAA
jgi:hypothetical protein